VFNLVSIFLLFAISCYSQLFAGWHNRRSEGWAWYEDAKKEKEEREQPKEKDLRDPEVAFEELKRAETRLKGYLAVALLDPSEKHIKRYLHEQKLWLDKSTLMAQNWQKVILNNTDLNQLIKYPSSQYGSKVWIEQQQQKKQKLIERLKESHGLSLFYEGESPVSKAFAKVAKRFSRKYGLDMVSTSVDGKVLSTLPKSRVDDTFAKQMGLEVYPALFLVDPLVRELIPISYGLNSVDVIENNIISQYREILEVLHEENPS